MKRLVNMMRSSIRPIAGIFLLALLITACKKNDYDNQNNIPAAGLMAFNLSPDKPAVGFALSGNNLGAALNYTAYTGAYLPIYVGTREVRSFDYNSGSTIAISSGNFADSMYYSTFLLGANGNYRNLVVKDELAPLVVAPGKAWVRYINAIPDSTVTPTVTIGDTEVNEAAPYASVSSFVQVDAGAVNTAINGGTISASRTITLEENKVYTILLLGIPNETDPDKVVQIRFIENGTVTP